MAAPRKIHLPRKQRAKLRFGKNAMIVLGLFAIYCFVNVWQNVSIAYLNRQNENLRKELQELNRQTAQLTLDIEQLKNPRRIREELARHMTLVPAEKINIQRSP